MPPKRSVIVRSCSRSTPVVLWYETDFCSAWFQLDTQTTLPPMRVYSSIAYCDTLPKPCTLAVVALTSMPFSMRASRRQYTQP